MTAVSSFVDRPLDGSLDFPLNGLQVLLGFRLEPQDQHGLGVRGPDQAPALGHDRPDAVDVDHRVFARELAADLLDDLELTSSEACTRISVLYVFGRAASISESRWGERATSSATRGRQ